MEIRGRRWKVREHLQCGRRLEDARVVTVHIRHVGPEGVEAKIGIVLGRYCEDPEVILASVLHRRVEEVS